MKNRTCTYCDGVIFWPIGTPRPANRCECKYRYMRMGASGATISSTCRDKTVAEMRAYLEEQISRMDQDAPVTFQFSVTRTDLKAMAKADAKRKGITDAA